MKKLSLKNKKIIAVLIASLISFTLIAGFIFVINSMTEVAELDRLDDGWTAVINNVLHEKAILSELNFDPLGKGSTVILKRTLPQSLPENPTIRFLVYHSVINVYVDDVLCYNFGGSAHKTGELVGSGYHWVSIPSDSAGKELTIKFNITETDAFANFEPIMLGSASNSYLEFTQSNRWSLFSSIFLVLFGGVLFLVVTPLLFYSRQFFRLYCIAIFSFLIGVWMMHYYKTIQLFSQNILLNTYIEFVSLYLAPIPLLLFINDIRRNKHNMLLKSLVILTLGYCTAALALQLANILHFPDTLILFHILVFTDIFYIAVNAVIGLKEGKSFDKIFFFCTIVLLTFTSADLIRFNYYRFVDSSSFGTVVSYMPVGVLIFVVGLIISYFVYILDSFYAQAENKLLTQLAYSDYLTKICNRTKCESVLKELDSRHCSYVIISFDLNNLKTVNDTLGHIYGDELIKTFASILNTCFAKYGTVGRMGGDEFIVIINNISETSLTNLLSVLHDAITTSNKLNKDGSVQISVSYGYAFSTEDNVHNSREVYQLADNRMYAMKSRTK